MLDCYQKKKKKKKKKKKMKASIKKYDTFIREISFCRERFILFRKA